MKYAPTVVADADFLKWTHSLNFRKYGEIRREKGILIVVRGKRWFLVRS